MDKWWKTWVRTFIHKLHTGALLLIRDLFGVVFYYKLLILLILKKLCTGKGLLNNNNIINFSNIY